MLFIQCLCSARVLLALQSRQDFVSLLSFVPLVRNNPVFQEKLSYVSIMSSINSRKSCCLELLCCFVGIVSELKYLSRCPALCLQLEAGGQCRNSDLKHPLLDGQAM